METEFHYLTKTAIELHNDEKFIRKRISEQAEYFKGIHLKWRLCEITTERYAELYTAASVIEEELYDRLDTIYGRGEPKFKRFRNPQKYLESITTRLWSIAEKKFGRLILPSPTQYGCSVFFGELSQLF